MSWFWIGLAWLLQTSIMPIAVGGATGLLAPMAWPGCGVRALRRMAWAAGAGWLAHMALVLVGLVRGGEVIDYAVVVTVVVATLLWRCRRATSARSA